jgi:hypothetical protein
MLLFCHQENAKQRPVNGQRRTIEVPSGDSEA